MLLLTVIPCATVKKSDSTTELTFIPSANAKGWGSLFVLATDVEQNVIYVGEGDDHPGLYRRALRIAPGELHWIDPLRELKTGESRRFDVRIRYRQPLQGAELFIRSDAAYLLFDEPQRGITPGQFAAWYDGDELVGSGVIAE